MPIQLTSTKFQTEEITPSLFGSNIVFPYSAFLHPGDRVTTALEDDIGVGTLRYPGGAVTETYFDIKNPNATSAPGHTNVLAQNEFFDILRDGANQSAVMVLPVTALIEHRATLSDFYHYVRLTLNEAWNGGNDPVTIETFELGNEWYYEGLTAEAYAAAAADIAKQARAAIENFANSLPANANWEAPTIAVQLADKQGDGNENETANAAMIDVFEAHDALTAIDAVTAHMYYPFGTEYFFGADIFYGEPVYSMWDAADAWDAALRAADPTAAPMDRVISEWNINTNSVNSAYLGLRAADPLMRMFSTMVQNGVDVATLWPTLVHPNALVTSSGELLMTGDIYKVMAEVMGGTRAVTIAADAITSNDYPWGVVDNPDTPNVDEGDWGFNVHGFQNDQKGYLIVTSFQDTQQVIDIDFGGMAGQITQATRYGTDGALDNENANLTQTDLSSLDPGDTFTLGGREFAVIEIDLSIDGNNSAETLTGTLFSEMIKGMGGADTLNGGGGYDTLYGGDGNDKLYGGSGDDKLLGQNGADKLYGQDGNDRLYGYDGNDLLYGNNGNDKLYGQNGSDKLYGQDGNDKLYGHGGNDKLYGNNGNDKLYGQDGNDNLSGGANNDKLYGGNGEDKLYGGNGNDRLWGGNDNDTLFGNSGNDILNGERGVDALSGGSGNDIFVFTNGQTTWGEKITDFTVGKDKIRIDLTNVNDMSDIAIFYSGSRQGYVIQFKESGNSSYLYQGSILISDPDRHYTWSDLHNAANFDFV